MIRSSCLCVFVPLCLICLKFLGFIYGEMVLGTEMENVAASISWDTPHSLLLCNPSYSQKEKNRFHSLLEMTQTDWPGHVWLSTSGSFSQKWVGLSKQALLASALAVNQHLSSDQTDCWVHALPNFHVGGVGIWARAYLSGAHVSDFKNDSHKWKGEAFYRYLQEVKGTLTALVPTQLHDLVKLGWQAPESLRAVIIGGGFLSPTLYQQAIALKWPVLPSYGLTECASQVATAPLESWKTNAPPSLQLLSHFQGEEREGILCFAGPSLLSTYAYFHDESVEFLDPKIDGWLMTEDRGTIHQRVVTIEGRADAMIKIRGESIDLSRLEAHLQTLRLDLVLRSEATLIAMPDARLGHSLCLVSDAPNQASILPLIEQFQQTVLPFERIQKFYFVSEFPRSAIGKILKKELMMMIS